MQRTTFLAGAAGLTFGSAGLAGPYSAPDQTSGAIDAGIPADSPAFVAWADDIIESQTSFAPGGSTSIDESGGTNSLGDLTAAEIAGGVAPGQITVGFPAPITDGAGPDFAVFENNFIFPESPFLNAELAFVEVSSNGVDFARFDGISTNDSFQGTFGQAFGGFDATNIYNLAGKHGTAFGVTPDIGTPFDLAELAADPLVTGGAVDLAAIRFVRLVDIPGNGDVLDSLGNPILDPWYTATPDATTAGFDFVLGTGSGVGVINAIPEPASLATFGLPAALLLRRRR